MKEVLESLTPVLEALALLATTVGFVVGVAQLQIGRREAQVARDLEVTLNLSESFRSKWEAGWRRELLRLEAAAPIVETSEDEELLNMLNWIDWLGNLIDAEHLGKVDVVMNAIGSQMQRMIEVGRPVLQHDISQHGADYWHGLLVVAERLGLEFDGVKA